MEISKLLTAYWAQISMIIFGVGYIIKLLLEYSTKRKEINHSLFQQSRIDCVTEYLSAYSKVISVFSQNNVISNFVLKLIEPEKADSLIVPCLDSLNTATSRVCLFFDDKIFQNFRKVSDNAFLIQHKLVSIYNTDDISDIIPELKNKSSDIIIEHYIEYKKNIEADNDKLIRQILKDVKNIIYK